MMKLFGSIGGWLLLLSCVACLVSSQEEAPAECIAPHALHDCLNNLQASERDWMAAVEAKERAVVEEWSQKLNLAVATAQTSHEQSHDQTREEWERATNERVTAVETEYQTKLDTLSKELQTKIRALEETIQSHQTTRDELEAAHAAALEQEREQFQAVQANAIRQAVQEADQKSSTGYSKLKHAKSLVDDELKLLKSQVVELQHHYTRSSNDLLEARQDLLKANEIVRLYHKKFYNRWILLPLTNTALKFYDTIGEPLLKELYFLGQPVWDPLKEHLWEPILQPVLQVLWEQVQSMFSIAYDVAELVWYQAWGLWDHTCEAVPPMVQSAVDKAWPHLTKAAKAVFTFLVKAYQQASDLYTKEVYPALEPAVFHPVRELYTTQVLPFYRTEVVPNWKKYVVQNYKTKLVPWWNTMRPLIINKTKNIQATLLLQWTAMAKALHSMARKRNMPPAIQDVTKYMAEHSQQTFLKTQQAMATILALLLLWRFVLRGKPAAKAAHGKTTNNTKPLKKKGATNNNGVQFQQPSTPPNAAGNKKKQHNARKATPFKAQ